jgi:methionine-rich copper-binding protein CopC
MPRLVALGAALLVFSAGRAMAHAQLVAAEPRVGSTVQQAPARLWLRFDQVIRLAESGVMLVEPDGGQVVLEPLSRDPKELRAVLAPLPPRLAAGRYEVRWRALSPDGHRTSGDFSFTVAHPMASRGAGSTSSPTPH